MARHWAQQRVSANRLCGAADVLLTAIRSPRGLETRVPMRVGGAGGGGALPERVFTRAELLEAMDMLRRMGFVAA